MAAPGAPQPNIKISTGSKMTFNPFAATVAKNGVFVSPKPRNMPCEASLGPSSFNAVILYA